MSPVHVTVWNEFRHERENDTVKALYPEGMHETIAASLRKDDCIEARTAALDDPEHGLSDEVLADTDVMIWWGHLHHGEVKDEVAAKVVQRVWEGMGFIALHSAHYSKPFTRLMGTPCGLQWRVDNKQETLWVVEPSHPITQGIEQRIVLPQTEMYGEWFQIPTPDELVFISWFEGGEVFRSGCTWKRGKGRVFYFRPGHETLPIYHNADVLRVIRNSVHWAAGRTG
jgi:trehalose utilization protein